MYFLFIIFSLLISRLLLGMSSYLVFVRFASLSLRNWSWDTLTCNLDILRFNLLILLNGWWWKYSPSIGTDVVNVFLTPKSIPITSPSELSISIFSSIVQNDT